MIFSYLTSFFLGLLGAVVISRFGKNVGLIDRPSHRSSHFIPTPKGGGVGILASFLVVSFISGMPISLWLPATIVSLLGLYDDRVELSPKLRLFIQFIAAFILISGMKFTEFNQLQCLLLIPLWCVFIVGTANFYNFMDGINGLAGITGTVGFGLLTIYLYFYGSNISIIPLALCIILACLGFLPFNLPQAKVFMGDSGSVLLGFVFASLVFILSERFLDFVCYASFIFPFYIDELSTMVIRLAAGESLLSAHRKHLYQLLANEKGIAHWKISLSYGLLQAVVGSSVILLKSTGITAVFLFLLGSSFVFVLVSFYIRNQINDLQVR